MIESVSEMADLLGRLWNEPRVYWMVGLKVLHLVPGLEGEMANQKDCH